VQLWYSKHDQQKEIAMTTFAISGMTCNGCRTKVEKALAAVVSDIVVTLEPPVAVTSQAVSLHFLNDALAKVGSYRATSGGDVQSTDKIPSVLKTYYPLFLVLGLLATASFASDDWMMAFMGGFYAVFGAFKLLDVPAFASAYSRYDVVAKAFKPWGYAYPFVEIVLGFAFLFHFQPFASTVLALVLSIAGAIGVIQATLSKQTIQCACLGTVFQLPMSVVTIIENLGMAAMAGLMLVHMGM
jgi:copper chaperone CopZ